MSLPINIKDLVRGQSVEWERLEFRHDWNAEKVIQTMCAFANDLHNLGGGYIIIGIDALDGMPILPISGLQINKLDKIQNEIFELGNRIQPTYLPIIQPYMIDGKHILVLWCPAGDFRPYSAPTTLGKQAQRQFYIRIGSSTGIAKNETLRNLYELAARVPFDDRVNQKASIDDFDLGLIHAYLQQVKSDLYEESKHISLTQLVRNMHIAKGSNEYLRPVNAGLLFFSRNPEKFFDRTWIEVVWRKDDVGDNFSEHYFKGPIHHQLHDALRFIKYNIIHENVIKVQNQAEALRFYNYPYLAVEEALANAVYHKGYDLGKPIEVQIFSDMITVLSYPSALPPVDSQIVNKQKIIARDYRNRRIGDFLKELELTEGRGTGFPKMNKEMNKNGSPEPIIETDSEIGYFLITLPINPEYVKHKDEPDESNQVDILESNQADITKNKHGNQVDAAKNKQTNTQKGNQATDVKSKINSNEADSIESNQADILKKQYGNQAEDAENKQSTTQKGNQANDVKSKIKRNQADSIESNQADILKKQHGYQADAAENNETNTPKCNQATNAKSKIKSNQVDNIKSNQADILKKQQGNQAEGAENKQTDIQKGNQANDVKSTIKSNQADSIESNQADTSKKQYGNQAEGAENKQTTTQKGNQATDEKSKIKSNQADSIESNQAEILKKQQGNQAEDAENKQTDIQKGNQANDVKSKIKSNQADMNESNQADNLKNAHGNQADAAKNKQTNTQKGNQATDVKSKIKSNQADNIKSNQAGIIKKQHGNQAEGTKNKQTNTKKGNQAINVKSNKFDIHNKVEEVLSLTANWIKRDELFSAIKVTNQTKHRKKYLDPLLKIGWIKKEFPDKKTHPNQRYKITTIGKKILKIIKQ
ncbi:MAG: hypothetical protein FWH18_08610 [Marinilabiliaceae bacterium]|nr:hypothetical protein [Marinilabiliaceae bacterium]